MGTLTDDDMKLLLAKTGFNVEEITQWHFDFLDECPTGKLSKAHLQRLFKRVFPYGDTENFVVFIFRLFDTDRSNILEFTEFLQVNPFRYRSCAFPVDLQGFSKGIYNTSSYTYFSDEIHKNYQKFSINFL